MLLYMASFSCCYTPLLFVGSLFYTLHAVLFGEFHIHTLWSLMWQVCVPCGERSFPCTPCVHLCGEFLSHSTSCFMWELSLTSIALFCVGSCSQYYTPHAVLHWTFLIHAPCFFTGDVVIHAHTVLHWTFLIHAPHCFI